jgi:hypothetical protein
MKKSLWIPMGFVAAAITAIVFFNTSAYQASSAGTRGGDVKTTRSASLTPGEKADVGLKPDSVVVHSSVDAAALVTQGGANTEASLVGAGPIDAVRTMQLLGSKSFDDTLRRLASERSDPSKAAEDQALLDEAIKASIKTQSLKTENARTGCSGKLCMAAFEAAASEEEISRWMESFSSTTNGLGSALFHDDTAMPDGRRQVRIILSTAQTAVQDGIKIPTNGGPVTMVVGKPTKK